MAIDLDNITSGYQVSKINANFQKVEDYINDKLLARAETGIAGEAMMDRDLDMDGNYILNAKLQGIDIIDQRALRVPLSEAPIDALPVASQRANKLLAFDSNGLPIVTIPSSGSAADVLIQLAASDGLKNIGQCPSVATLRTIEPSANGQLIFLRSHTNGTFKGGGLFKALLTGTGYTDNNGTIIKTTGGAVWLRQFAEVTNPLMFGAVGDGVANDTAAINSAIAASREVDLLGLTYTLYGNQVLVDNAFPTRVYNGTLQDSSSGNNNLMYVSGSFKIIEEISFIGTNGPTSRGIIVRQNSTDITIRNNSFRDMKYYAIAVSYDYVNNTRCSRITIDNNYIDHCGIIGTGGASGGASSILLDQVFTTSVTNNNLLRCNWGISFVQPFTPPTPTEPFGFYNRAVGNRISGSGKTGNPYAESQGISAQSQKHLIITNNVVEQFNGNGIDNQRCENSTIIGNTVRDCYDAFFIGDMSFTGHVIQGNNTVNCERGIRVLGDASGSFVGQNMRSSVISGNVFLDSTLVGIFVHHDDATGTFENMVITDNVVDDFTARNNAAHVCGIQLTGLRGGIVNNNVIRNQRGYSVIVESSIGTQLHDNMVNSYDLVVLGRAAIYLDSQCVGVTVRNLTSFGATTAGPAVFINGNNNTAIGVRFRGPASGILNSGTNSQVSDNFAF